MIAPLAHTTVLLHEAVDALVTTRDGGACCGSAGLHNVLRPADGREVPLPGRCNMAVAHGDRVIIETCGGGGYGTPPAGGVTGAPFDSFLTLRGIRTLHPRIKQHEESASRVADVLNSHDLVDRVYYPGLASHPGHDIAKRQQRGFGGMLSFEINGNADALRGFVEHLQFFSLAESLGGVESLVCHPASMTHAPVSPEVLAKAGIGQNLVRLSVGLESSEDLIADLLAALEAARSVRTRSVVAAVVA